MDRAALLAALRRDTAAFTRVLETGDLHAPVQACPGWDLAELAAHLAGVHRWARTAVVEGELRAGQTPALPDREAVVAWYASAAQGLLDALTATPSGTPCPGFGARPHTVDFWVRRQAHETAVHRWDAERAARLQPVLDPDLSADGVGEVVQVMLPRQLRLGRVQAPAVAVALEQSDGAGRWTVGEGAAPVATVRGEAATLMLLLWRRVPLDGVQVEGDRTAAAAVLASPLTP